MPLCQPALVDRGGTKLAWSTTQQHGCFLIQQRRVGSFLSPLMLEQCLSFRFNHSKWPLHSVLTGKPFYFGTDLYRIVLLTSATAHEVLQIAVSQTKAQILKDWAAVQARLLTAGVIDKANEFPVEKATTFQKFWLQHWQRPSSSKEGSRTNDLRRDDSNPQLREELRRMGEAASPFPGVRLHPDKPPVVSPSHSLTDLHNQEENASPGCPLAAFSRLHALFAPTGLSASVKQEALQRYHQSIEENLAQLDCLSPLEEHPEISVVKQLLVLSQACLHTANIVLVDYVRDSIERENKMQEGLKEKREKQIARLSSSTPSQDAVTSPLPLTDEELSRQPPDIQTLVACASKLLVAQETSSKVRELMLDELQRCTASFAAQQQPLQQPRKQSIASPSLLAPPTAASASVRPEKKTSPKSDYEEWLELLRGQQSPVAAAGREQKEKGKERGNNDWWLQ
ncbi:hypothetical protein QOT17_021803 [Balamuthia mandrillaris]